MEINDKVEIPEKGIGERIMKAVLNFDEWILEMRRKFEAKHKHE